MIKKNSNKNKGLTIIEVLVACFVISVTIFPLMFAASKGIELSFNALRQTQSSYLLEEGVEAVKLIRDTNWSGIANLNSDGVSKYYLSWNSVSNQWEISETPSIIDSMFTREIIFSDVYRDSNDDIYSSGTIDLNTKKVEIIVSFDSTSGEKTNNIIFYITNIFN